MSDIKEKLKEAVAKAQQSVKETVEEIRENPTAVAVKGLKKAGSVSKRVATDIGQSANQGVRRPVTILDGAVDWVLCRPDYSKMIEEFVESDLSDDEIKEQAMARFKRNLQGTEYGTTAHRDGLIAVIPGLNLLGVKVVAAGLYADKLSRKWADAVLEDVHRYRFDPVSYDLRKKQREDWIKTNQLCLPDASTATKKIKVPGTRFLRPKK